jgi:hypothetical protein
MADDYQNGAQGAESKGARESLGKADALFCKLQKWLKLDYDSRGQTTWRREAREDFDFEVGEQLNEDESFGRRFAA